jgi:hypothetical protein
MKFAVGGKTKTGHLFSSRMGIGSWIVLIVLLLLLVASVVAAYLGWTLGDEVALPLSDYVAMALGVVFSLGFGIGLMALLFYSSRNGFDEPPVLISPGKDPTRTDRAPDPPHPTTITAQTIQTPPGAAGDVGTPIGRKRTARPV